MDACLGSGHGEIRGSFTNLLVKQDYSELVKNHKAILNWQKQRVEW